MNYSIQIYRHGQFYRTMHFRTRVRMLRIARCYNNSPDYKALVTY
jgi:hypothetical protein